MTICSYAQIRYEKGYFISNSGIRTDCFIKNVDWKNNPTEFEYVLSEGAVAQTATLEDVQEFGITAAAKYKRFLVKIDRSGELMSDLSRSKDPVFTEEQLFLMPLVEGRASLYYYEDRSLKRFFYSTDSIPLTQLIAKKYLTPNNKVGKNDRYKQQLWYDLKCSTFSMLRVDRIRYTKDDLIKHFDAYNACNSTALVENKQMQSQKREWFNLSIRPALTWATLSAESLIHPRDPRFGIKRGVSLGIEAEFILPFNKNKWAITLEPLYQSYKGEHQMRIQKATVEYWSFEVPLGLRHYFFLSDDSKVFINGAYVFNVDINSSIEFENELDNDLDLDPISNFALGAGYTYRNRYTAELRCYSNRELMNYGEWKSRYSNISLIFGYKLL